jgi:hypothetical protein
MGKACKPASLRRPNKPSKGGIKSGTSRCLLSIAGTGLLLFLWWDGLDTKSYSICWRASYFFLFSRGRSIIGDVRETEHNTADEGDFSFVS